MRMGTRTKTVSYTHLRAHETPEHLVCRLLLEKKTHGVHDTRTAELDVALALASQRLLDRFVTLALARLGLVRSAVEVLEDLVGGHGGAFRKRCDGTETGGDVGGVAV